MIGGTTDPRGARTGFGSLLLGVMDDKGALRYALDIGNDAWKGYGKAACRLTAAMKLLDYSRS